MPSDLECEPPMHKGQERFCKALYTVGQGRRLRLKCQLCSSQALDLGQVTYFF